MSHVNIAGSADYSNKLSTLALASVDAAKWKRCEAIGEIDGQKSLECKFGGCKRKCEAGFVAVKPLKAS